MTENYFINNIDVLKTQSIQDVSIIGDIIRQIVDDKISNLLSIQVHTKTYDIEDKIKLNKIEGTLKFKITSNYIEYFDKIEQALDIIREIDPRIDEKLYEHFKNLYLDQLIAQNIDINNSEEVTSQSVSIYVGIERKLFSRYDSVVTGIKYEELCSGIYGIVAYVFYKCKILVPIEKG